MTWNRIHIFALFAGLILVCSCERQSAKYPMTETILTTGAYGRTLNATQVFSPDNQWIVYDTRNDDTHIQYTRSIEKVNIITGEVVSLYKVADPTKFGPGVGAAAFHPSKDKIIFIHGLLNCNEKNPYGFTRRFGAIVESTRSSIIHAEGRTVREPLIAGTLRGGTHAHTWSGDGEWLSFTYNDYLMESLEKSFGDKVKDLRTIGVMAPLQKVTVPIEDDENFSGEYFAVAAAVVKEDPTFGSDEIERAFDECWIGKDGYIKADGTRQKRAIAFQGNVRAANGTLVTEVFVADIPEDITQADQDKPLQGTVNTRPNVPKGSVQRRLTFTTNQTFPGVQGPRFRLRSSPDGSEIYFLMKDDKGIVQIFSISTLGGTVRQVTHLAHAIQSQFNVSPDGKQLSAVADNSIWLIEIITGNTVRVTEKSQEESAPVGGALWSHNGKLLVFNRYIGEGDQRYLQIIKIDLE